MYIANKADSGLLNGSSPMKHRRIFFFGESKINVSEVPKQKLRSPANLVNLCSELPLTSEKQVS